METAQKILIVDDEPDIVRGLKYNFEFEGYIVETAENGILGFEKLTKEKFDLAVLDVMMPGMSGFDLCRSIRQKGIKIPVILLTAKGEEIDKVLGLELGADDYITKPFSLRELLARVKAVLRRTVSIDEAPTDKIEVGNLVVDLKTFEAISNGNPIKMSSREIEILSYLYQRKEQTVDRYEMMETLWETDSDVTTRTIDNFIVKLRQKIEDNPSNPRHIITIHGKGYKLTV
ncbi:MAG: response regulator transcription factor [Prolixibacteraceae bacterium]|nr:response regulator transcription factor [Prolixibacteraceae bacterium]